MKKTFSNFKRMSKKSGIIYILANLFNVWLNGRQLDSPICFQSVVVLLFGLKYRKTNPASHRYVSGRRSILIAFSDNCGYSLILCQNSTINTFLNASYNLESETISVNIHTATLEFIHLS